MISRHRPVTTMTFQTGAATTETVTIALRQVTNPARISLISNQIGLGSAKVIIEGRLQSPKSRPAALKATHKAPLTWAGRDGLATLEPYQGALLPGWESKYGEKLLLTWEATV